MGSIRLVRRELEARGVQVAAEFDDRVDVFLDELARWHAVGRLTGYRTREDQIQHLIVDSLLFLCVIPEPASPLIDIGTGIGIPGLVLKLARPAWEVTLVESARRRANFLRAALRRLDLPDVQVEHARAEQLLAARSWRARFRTVTLRAVASPVKSVRLAGAFIEPGGRVVVSAAPDLCPAWGQIREVPSLGGAPVLSRARRFLIIAGSELPGVPRGTRGNRAQGPGRGQPEGRRGEDHHGGEPGGGAGGGGAGHAPGRS